MKRLLITIFKYCGLFLLLIAIFNIAFYLVCLIDSDLMYGNVEKSSKILRKEGYYYQVSKVFDVKNDTYVDAETVNASYSMDNKTIFNVLKNISNIDAVILSNSYDNEIHHWEKGIPLMAVYKYLLTIANSNFEGWMDANPDASIYDFKFDFTKMSASGSLFDIEKLYNISKNHISRMKASDVYDEVSSEYFSLSP